MSASFLLASPCEPGNCHIYFCQQRRALPYGLALARAVGRTLLLPPFEYYDGQAQIYTSQFVRTVHGRSPRFVRWSDLFDITPLREQAGVVELSDLIEGQQQEVLGIHAAIYAKVGDAAPKRVPTISAQGDDALSGVFNEVDCSPQPHGLLANLSRQSSVPSGFSGELYGTTVRSLRCGTLALAPEAARQGDTEGGRLASLKLQDWFGDVPLAAVFNVGHQTQSKLTASATELKLAVSLRPKAELREEAEAVVAKLRAQAPQTADTEARRPSSLDPSSAAGCSTCGNAKESEDSSRQLASTGGCYALAEGEGLLEDLGNSPSCRDQESATRASSSAPFVAIHWRHGDYVAYGYLSGIERVIEAARTALAELGCPTCRVFLMSNCRNTTAWEELRQNISTLSTYEPSREHFKGEGQRLVIEQHVATLANIFLGSSRSAVSQLIFQARGGLQGGSSQSFAAQRPRYL